jgi:hypothetical protein
MTGAQIVQVLMSAGPGLFSYFKRERALSKAQKYLCGKYGLTVIVKDNGSTSVMAIYRVYQIKWKATTCELLQRILSAAEPSLALADDCADFVLIIAILAARASNLGPYFGTGPDYSYANSLRDSKTFLSIENLSRGIGGHVAMQLIHRELYAWAVQYRLLPQQS